jgi:hypothetical protein
LKFKGVSIITNYPIITLLVLAITISGCAPSGGHVNKELSNSHYYNATHTSIIYGPNGNCLELGCEVIENADIDTFEVLNNIYALDKNYVYFKRQILTSEKPNTFRLAKGPYAVGALGTYWYGELFDAKNPDSFTAVEFNIDHLTNHYGLDNKYVYCRKNVLSKKPESFRPFEKQGYFEDGDNLYYINGGVCEKIEVDIHSFEFLKKDDGSRSVYAKDANSIYVMSVQRRKIKEADVTSFKVLCTGVKPPQYALDKNYVYDFGKPILGTTPETFEFPDSCKP